MAAILGCLLVAFFVVSASRYDASATLICSAIAVACAVFYAWDIVVLTRNKADFELVLTTSRLLCHSPNQRLCPDFDVELTEIDRVACDSNGDIKLVTSTASEIDLSLARNFGAPVRLFVQDIARQNPDVIVESTR